MIAEAVQRYVSERGWGKVLGAEAVGGGCINDGRVLTTERGPKLFLKTNAAAPPTMFACEAEGLAALADVPGGPRVPQPLLSGDDFLLLEYLAPAPRRPDAWEVLGRQLARLHAKVAPQFGFPRDNFIGSTPQPNGWLSDGFQFFAERRLLFQGKLARERGLLDAKRLQQLERLAARLRDLIPEQPASLIHGDLWSGNVIIGPEGYRCLIDPAAHYGWAEAELAMTALFGGFPDSFYRAYESVRPLAPGYRSRFNLYNLYHLLNHLNLFGRSYLGQVEAVLRQYA
ncbi:MAG: fructosamine kinase family protein [Anaerolineales bacterium]|nr:fructosamine kinase family protein [Anaerolineales bacterium]